MYGSVETTGRWTVEERPQGGTRLISGATLCRLESVGGKRMINLLLMTVWLLSVSTGWNFICTPDSCVDFCFFFSNFILFSVLIFIDPMWDNSKGSFSVKWNNISLTSWCRVFHKQTLTLVYVYFFAGWKNDVLMLNHSSLSNALIKLFIHVLKEIQTPDKETPPFSQTAEVEKFNNQQQPSKDPIFRTFYFIKRVKQELNDIML